MHNSIVFSSRTARTVPAGFSLIEVMVAMVLLVIVVTSLAGVALSLARNSVRNEGRSFQTGLLAQEIDRAVAAPIESLALRLGQTQRDTPVTTPWPFERQVAISGRADSLTVKIAIKPVHVAQRPDSIVHSVLRTR